MGIIPRPEIRHQVGHNVLSDVAHRAIAAVEVGREGHVLEEAARHVEVELAARVAAVDEEVDWEDGLGEGGEEAWGDQGKLGIVLDGVFDEELAVLGGYGVVVFPCSILLTEFDQLIENCQINATSE